MLNNYRGPYRLFALFANALRATARPLSEPRRLSTKKNRPGSPRLAPAREGGNWKGVPYLSYSEYDAIKRYLWTNPPPPAHHSIREVALKAYNGRVEN